MKAPIPIDQCYYIQRQGSNNVWWLVDSTLFNFEDYEDLEVAFAELEFLKKTFPCNKFRIVKAFVFTRLEPI